MAYQMAERAAGMGPQHRRQDKHTGRVRRIALPAASSALLIFGAAAVVTLERAQPAPAPQATVQSFNDGFAASKQDDCQQGFRPACAWASRTAPRSLTTAAAVLGGRLGASGLTWQYVSPGEARYFRISPRSVVVTGFGRFGQDANTIITPRGRIVATS